ncbi:MAG: SDR family oxidoreductase [Eubacteriales bacterium]|nr:SDR family oxidoreductase [Eubacteriales bacterium]
MNNFGSVNDIFNVHGKKALITGGTKGIGRAIALCLMENGCDVMLVSRNTQDARDLIEFSSEKGVNCHLFPSDLTASGASQIVAQQAEQAMGTVDILINAAGMNHPKLIEDMDDENWEQILRLNLTATFRMCRETIRIMKKHHYGKIVNISSMKSVLGVSNEGYTAYCASKGAVNMLTKQIACEVAADGITVNAVAPTFIKTAINAHQLEDPVYFETLVNRIPVGRIGEFSDLMGPILLLVSDASQFITGQVYLLDGGLSARQ